MLKANQLKMKNEKIGQIGFNHGADDRQQTRMNTDEMCHLKGQGRF
jgi:hypothetical protein